MDILKKLNPKSLSLVGVAITVGGFVLSQIGETVTAEQNNRMISQMVQQEVARQLNKK